MSLSHTIMDQAVMKVGNTIADQSRPAVALASRHVPAASKISSNVARLSWQNGNPLSRSVSAKAIARKQKREKNVICQSSASDKYTGLSQVTTVLGSQWGDEGKGKLVDILAQNSDLVIRAQGGANAGHTIYDEEGNKYALHQVPSGILNPKAQCVIGHGVVVYLPGLFEEIEKLEAAGVNCQGRIMLSDRAHLLFDLHRAVDGMREEALAGKKIGTTKRGIGPAYATKAYRVGARVCELYNPEVFASRVENMFAETKAQFPDFDGDAKAEIEKYTELAERVKPFVGDTHAFVNQSYTEGKTILVEGANATMLDIDFGTYPYVTSSSPCIGGVISGIGLAPAKFGDIIGVAKAYTTRVGSGPYPTELFGDEAEAVRAKGFEYGTTTGRPRRCGWLDMVALNYAHIINGFTSINLTKLDVLSGLKEIQLGVAYKDPATGETTTSMPADADYLETLEVVYETLPGWEEDISDVREYADLPEAAKAYITRVEELLLDGIKCTYIGVGPGRDAMVVKP